MNRGILLLMLPLLIPAAGAYAASGETAGANSGVSPEFVVEFTPLASYAQSAAPDAVEVPRNIRNNRYFLESVRLNHLAQESYDEGDYDTSMQYAVEALRYAQLSDEYVALQLKIRETDMAIAAARSRLDWAVSVNAPARYPGEYSRADAEYQNARGARGAEDWDGAIAAANRVLLALAAIDSAPGSFPLPAQYTVRAWNISKDCFWNIAGRSWVYGDPEQWRLIYNANKSRLPNPDNPNIIEPGMVLDIPSIKGETRQGMWDAGRKYSALP